MSHANPLLRLHPVEKNKSFSPFKGILTAERNAKQNCPGCHWGYMSILSTRKLDFQEEKLLERKLWASMLTPQDTAPPLHCPELALREIIN